MYMWRSDVIPQDSYLELTNSVRLAARAHQGSAYLSPSAEIRGTMRGLLCGFWACTLVFVLAGRDL